MNGIGWSAWIEEPVVIESGENGIWKWKKYSDGTAECIGMIDVSSADVTVALGGWYRCPNLYDVADYPYPVSFSEIPTVEMMFQTTNSTAALLWTFSSNESNAKLYLPQCYLIRTVTGSNCNGKINIIVKGKI